MDTKDFSEWLDGMSVPQRVRVLVHVYANLTIYTREVFLPGVANGKEETVLHMLHGMNELHHTLSNWLGNYVTDATKAFPVETLTLQLSQIASHYRIDGWLFSAIQRARKTT